MAEDSDNPMIETAATVQQQEWSRTFARESVRRMQAKTAQPKATAKNKAADQALAAISKSPAGANPWVRLILLVNNLLNRLTGKPPNSAENITILVQMLAAVIAILALLLAIIIGALIFFLINLVANPGLIVQVGLCNIFGGLMNFFGNTACAGTP